MNAPADRRRSFGQLPRSGARAFVAAALVAVTSFPAAAEDFSIVFGQGPGERRVIQFDDSAGNERWFMTRCQNAVSPDYYVVIREFGDSEQIKAVGSALEADSTVCVIGHIPDIVKRYMR